MAGMIKIRNNDAARSICVLIIGCLWMVAGAASQTQTLPAVSGNSQPATIPTFAQFLAPVAGRGVESARPIQVSASLGWNAAASSVPGPGIHRITLDEAQEQAQKAANPMFHLAALGVEAAKQHRLGVQSDFFPKISSTFMNMHFNKFLGQILTVKGPLGNQATFAVPIFTKDETLVAATVMQPITPLFKLKQVLNIARADERVAQAKAGMPIGEVASNVEQSYFALLVAQRQEQVAKANVRKSEAKWHLASVSAVPAGLAEHETEWIEVDKALVLASSKVKEAAAALNALLGWPAETELELVIPAAFHEYITPAAAVEQALQNNPEVVEAEQTVVKARAASKLSKLEYVPDVAVTGGYAYQDIMPSLPGDMSYIGVMANYNLFDFGKRERTVKERNAQVAMAETGLTLVKAKVAASVTKAYFELDRARQLSELAQRMNSNRRVIAANYEPEEASLVRAKSEAEMLQAELEYRLAFAKLQQLIGASVGK